MVESEKKTRRRLWGKGGSQTYELKKIEDTKFSITRLKGFKNVKSESRSIANMVENLRVYCTESLRIWTRDHCN
jgi:hypothetical protein